MSSFFFLEGVLVLVLVCTHIHTTRNMCYGGSSDLVDVIVDSKLGAGKRRSAT